MSIKYSHSGSQLSITKDDISLKFYANEITIKVPELPNGELYAIYINSDEALAIINQLKSTFNL